MTGSALMIEEPTEISLFGLEPKTHAQLRQQLLHEHYAALTDFVKTLLTTAGTMAAVVGALAPMASPALLLSPAFRASFGLMLCSIASGTVALYLVALQPKTHADEVARLASMEWQALLAAEAAATRTPPEPAGARTTRSQPEPATPRILRRTPNPRTFWYVRLQGASFAASIAMLGWAILGAS